MTIAQKLTHELVNNDRIEIAGVHYDVKRKYIADRGTVTLDLEPIPESVIRFNVRLQMPVGIGVNVITQ